MKSGETGGMALMKQFVCWLEDESGQGLVEYAFIIMLVALAAVGTLRTMATPLSGFFDRANDEFR